MRVLLDEMWPLAAATRLRHDHGVDAHHVHELGLGGAPESAIAAHARSQGMVVVTENVRDFADEDGVALVFILNRHLPSGGAMKPALADIVARWHAQVPEPALRAYWPRSA